MKKTSGTQHNVIRRESVRVVAQPAMLDCGAAEDGRQAAPMAIVPMLDGDRVAGFEVRCGCGASAIVECVYEDPQPEEAQ